ncbi:DUF4012 domain-containing protein [Paenarthrobacter nitroguajacolicus]
MVAAIWVTVAAVTFIAAALWLGSRVTTVKSELEAAAALLPALKTQIAANDVASAAETVEVLAQHTGSAREASRDPLWQAASALPWLGPNLAAASEVATSADDVARLGALPLANTLQSLNWEQLKPTPAGIDLAPLKKAAPQIQAAAHAVSESSRRLNDIDVNALVPQMSTPLLEVRTELAGLSSELMSAADASTLTPAMLGADGPRRYLLMMQNNSESRATGGIPGALAVLSLDRGKLSLESQTSAGAMGSFDPAVPIDAEQQAIFSKRVGKFMQDVNLTPDFPTSASTAHSMWERDTGERLDGVLSLDPVALSFILEATGPVPVVDPTIGAIGAGLPKELTRENVVRTLLSDAYASIEDPDLQDVYFAGAAKSIFGALSSGNTDPKKLIGAVTKGVEERRILIWSGSAIEQDTIGRYPIGGMIFGHAVTPAQFGVYFNDGTGAKMDYWIKRSVQVVKDCTRDGYREVAVRVTSTNAAPADAATSLPAYVTGNGAFGVPPGTVQTNVVAYGPVQSNIDTVVKDGTKIPFAAQHHRQRAVGTSTIRLAPGESTTLDFNFGHIVQHSEPELVVTPTTQAVKDVIQATPPLVCE